MRNPLAVIPQRLLRRNPDSFRALSEMTDEMNRWLQAPSPWTAGIEGAEFTPACNFSETGKEFVVQLDVPGVKKEDVKIEIENSRLIVSGERKEEHEEKSAKQFLAESFYGSFVRSFNLPTGVDENKVDAHYENGVLTITLPKVKTSKAKEVQIH